MTDWRKRIIKGVSRALRTSIVDMPFSTHGDMWSLDESDGVRRKAVYTDAFWLAPPYGRPRDIDYERLEPLEKNAWVKMCVQHIVDSVVKAEWNIVQRNKEKEVSDATLKEVKEFFEGGWTEDFATNLRMMLPDLLHYDCGVTIKAFAPKDYKDTGEIINTKRKPVELYSRDGRSFMKDTGLAGRLRQYWQYSWINPQGKPIKFSPDEILYFQLNPSSRSPYGVAPLEIVEDIIDYMIDSARAQSKYWKNGMFVGGQIDMPEVKDFNELKRYQAYFESKLRGSRKFGKWIVTGGGTDVKTIPFNAQQMQWVESQKWFAKIVFAMFKVTPSELGFTEDLNRATGIQQMEINKSHAVMPVLQLLQDTINRQIVWKHFNEDVMFEYDATLCLADKKLQSEIDSVRLDKGIISVNEVRDRDGLEKWEDEKWNMPMGQAEGKEEEEEEGDDGFDWGSMFDQGDDEEPDEEPDFGKMARIQGIMNVVLKGMKKVSKKRIVETGLEL
jgi:HK97 family phage portal protein